MYYTNGPSLIFSKKKKIKLPIFRNLQLTLGYGFGPIIYSLFKTLAGLLDEAT